jgi:hypothetical protein
VRVEEVLSCPRRRWSLCDEPTDAVGNSGRIGIFVLGSHGQLGQQRPVSLLGRAVLDTRMRTLAVVPVDVGVQVLAGSAHRLVGLQVHPLVPDGAPQPFYEHVVAPGTLAVHGHTTSLESTAWVNSSAVN